MPDTCPHCYRKVILKADGRCPSCGRDFNDRSGMDATRVVLVVRPSTQVPPLCFNCARPATKRAVQVISNVEKGRGLQRWALARTFGKLIPFFNLFTSFNDAKNDISFQVMLPICNACRRKKVPIRIDFYDLVERQVHFVVHRALAEATRAMNAPNTFSHE